VSPGDLERVTELLGRSPQSEFTVLVRGSNGDPLVVRNAPFLFDGTPMPTLYWLVPGPVYRAISRIEADGGIRAAQAALDPLDIAATHVAYASERDALIDPAHTGPRPTGGVGGTREGVKCLHAHYAHHLAVGNDPIGVWVEQRLIEAGEALR
jgi:hypothetical protein